MVLEASVQNSEAQTVGGEGTTQAQNMNKDTQTQTGKARFSINSIHEQLKDQLKGNRLKSADIEKVEFGKTKLKNNNNAVILSWNDDANCAEKIQKKLADKSNKNLQYSSPLEVLESEPSVQDEDAGMLVYVAIKFKKDTRVQLRDNDSVIDPEDSDDTPSPNQDSYEGDTESDSGVGDSGNSRNGESPECDEDELRRADTVTNKANTLTPPAFHQRMSQLKVVKRQSKPSWTDEKEHVEKLKQRQKENAEKLKQRQMIREKYTMIRKRTNIKTRREVNGPKDKDEKLVKITKPLWLIPGSNSFHVNINPTFSSQQPKCYSFQCKPRVRLAK